MSLYPTPHKVHIVRLVKYPPRRLVLHASLFRTVRLQSLRDDPDSFTETYAEAAARPSSYWQDLIRRTPGLIHVALGTFESLSKDLDQETMDDWMSEHGVPLGMAMNVGPVPREHFLCPPGSGIALNRPDAEEIRFQGRMLYIIPSVRGKAARGHLLETMTLDRDLWLLDQLKACDTDPPPVARFRATIFPGLDEGRLLEFYTGAGWTIAGKLTWAQSRLAEGGEEAVQTSKACGHDMDKLSVVVERIWTVPHLEWRITKNQRLMGQILRQQHQVRAKV